MAASTTPKKIVVCFDGSGNSPEISSPFYTENGSTDEHTRKNNFTNPLMTYLLAGGRIDNIENERDNKFYVDKGIPENQIALYVRGVGEHDKNLWNKMSLKGLMDWDTGINALFGDIDVPMKAMDKRLEKVIQPGDKVFIFGFSRGAAAARVYAVKLSKKGIKSSLTNVVVKPEIPFLGCWDTVSLQIFDNCLNVLLNTLFKRLPSTKAIGEKDGKVASNVKKAIHIVSLDDNRMWAGFSPTLMGHEERVHEVWFPGGHGDIGGNAPERYLSDISFKYMLDSVAGDGDDKLHFLDPSKLDETAMKCFDEDTKRTCFCRPEFLHFKGDAAKPAQDLNSLNESKLRNKNRRPAYVAKDNRKYEEGIINVHISVLEQFKAQKNSYLMNPYLKDVKFVVVGNKGEVLEGKEEELLGLINETKWED
mmetsp:Transcript_8815/g.12528  ORF Transcript_8815/g.12528 Transcript_8815/m.12528 type:complete len:421 (-) Transcript_8815:296-1558(-)